MSDDRRLDRERRTVNAMLKLFCHQQHGKAPGLCEQCAALRQYAECRLDRCPFGADKPTCANCPIHCYRPDLREQIRAVMRYAGPRLMFRHPILAIQHLLDGRKKGKKQVP